jgi:hypothetical protein
MRIWRGAGVAGAWALATGLGALLVWVGLRPVLDAAVPDRSAALSAADARAMAAPSLAPAPAPALPTAASPPRSPAPAASAAPTPGGSPRATTSAPASRSAAPPAPDRVVDGWTVSTRADGTPSYVRSFHVTGGDAVIGMTPGRVYLISATPRSGYTVLTSQPQPVRLVVQFVDGNLANIVDAIWWNGAPYAQVT